MLKENQPLAGYHTFALQASARYFSIVEQESDIMASLQLPYEPKLILGGGSNVLFTKDFPGLIIKNAISGINRVEESEVFIVLEIGAGVIWHELVQWTVANNYGGLENLSLIPGTVGAAPIQNIGAYGVEFDTVFHGLTAIEMQTGKRKYFNRNDCEFGYRDSVFKRALKNKYFIVNVEIKLTKKDHVLTLNYGDVKSTLENAGIFDPTIQDVSAAIMAIRKSKLPDPMSLGNAGSFFKNPVIPEEKYENLCLDYPDLPGYPSSQGMRKVPAAWLIERAGWKGFRNGDAGVYEKHALVLVNYGLATGNEMYKLAESIKRSIKEIFDIDLESEVNMI